MMRREYFYALCLALSLCVPFASLSAHPHTYLDAELGIVLDTNGVQALSFRWAPLRNFCDQLIAYDRNSDGRFDGAETEAVRVDAFEAIEKYHYFIHIDVDGVPYRIATIEDFSVQLGGGQVYFSFSTPCRIPAMLEESRLTISMRDETSYVSFALRYVDDGQDDAIVSALEIIRDGSVYSHGSDFGNQDVCLSFRLANPEPGKDCWSSIPSGLIAESALQAIPDATHANPFFKTGLEPVAGVQDGGNPFFSGP